MRRFDRRGFLRTMGGAAVASVLDAVPGLFSSKTFAFPPSPKTRVLVFFEPDFPTVDGLEMTRAFLVNALGSYEVTFADGDSLPRALSSGSMHVFITPYGSAFPKDSWPAIERYLLGGGNWINLGGVPLAIPVRRGGNGWHQEIHQTAYHKRIGITQSTYVGAAAPDTCVPCDASMNGLLGEFTAQRVYGLSVRLTNSREFPDEDGSEGPRDAILRPLIHAVTHENIPGAAPFVSIDRLQGKYAGGRWVMANFKGRLSARGLRILIDHAAQNASSFVVRTGYARYRSGERIEFSAVFASPKGVAAQPRPAGCSVIVTDQEGNAVGSSAFTMSGKKGVLVGKGRLRATQAGGLASGLYRIKAIISLQPGSPGSVNEASYESGFVVADDSALAGGIPFTHDGRYFLREGTPYPVTGTTYMASDAHRKFLLDPNPLVWDRDFAAMKDAGVNLVRTGIWTGWAMMSDRTGKPHEDVLRAMDAFVLTAKRFDIPIIFTFFAFLPEDWGGENPYLDPRSLKAQKEFVGAFAHRYASVDDMMWDLINEPSFCSARHLWQCRPNYDRFEQREWDAWLRQRYPAGSDEERRALLWEMWRCTPDEGVGLPSIDDFGDAHSFGTRRPLKSIDYRLFAQEMFARWVREVSSAIRTNGNSNQHITVGQDEGGTLDRPSPQFHGDSVDFTSVHTWWFNDDLLWDAIVTRIPGKPHLIEETGTMFAEKLDGSAWRDESAAEAMLDKKIALAFAAGGAGAVQWIWNTNPYMNSDNEAAIGFFRVDGTAKPELSPFKEVARWMWRNRTFLSGAEPERVVMVIPHSHQFSPRDFATAATRAAVRAMEYHCRVPISAVGEYQVPDRLGRPEVILLPSPMAMSSATWKTLLDHVEEGATLAVTGPFDRDEHWLPTGRMNALGIEWGAGPVQPEEWGEFDGVTRSIPFRGEKMQRLEKAFWTGSGKFDPVIRFGNGRILWDPLPLELGDDIQPLALFYGRVLREAGVIPIYAVEPNSPGVLIRPLIFRDAVLYIAVSDSGWGTRLSLTHKETGLTVPVTVGYDRSAYVLVSRGERKEISRTTGD